MNLGYGFSAFKGNFMESLIRFHEKKLPFQIGWSPRHNGRKKININNQRLKEFTRIFKWYLPVGKNRNTA